MKLTSLFLCFFLAWSGAVFAEKEFSLIRNVDEDLYSVATSPVNKNIIVLGSENAIFITRDGGKHFEKVFVVKGDDSKVNDILFDFSQHDKIYFATDAGMYVTDNLGKTMEKVFSKYKDEGGYVNALSLYEYNNSIYLGTEEGLYKVGKELYDFRINQGIPRGAIISDVRLIDNQEVIVATNKGVYLSQVDKINAFRRTFISRNSQELNHRNIPQCFAVSGIKSEIIYLGTSDGVFVSKDRGNSWHKVDAFGLTGLNVRALEFNKTDFNELFIATDNGLFKYKIENKIVDKIMKGDVRDIFSDDRGNILLATDSGLYSYLWLKKEMHATDAKKCFKNEPNYMEVYEAALGYNEVHPGQIKRWRNSLKYRALFPKLKVDYDKTIYGSSSGKFAVGPYDWGVSLSWDIGDLIWNSYEDDIDTKSRLKTQTRIDISDDLRRIYFQRKELKIELRNNPPESESERMKKEFYLEELTAALDGYTGGYFSQRCRELKEG